MMIIFGWWYIQAFSMAPSQLPDTNAFVGLFMRFSFSFVRQIGVEICFLYERLWYKCLFLSSERPLVDARKLRSLCWYPIGGHFSFIRPISFLGSLAEIKINLVLQLVKDYDYVIVRILQILVPYHTWIARLRKCFWNYECFIKI